MNILHEEYKVILERKKNCENETDGDNSYTKYLFREGINKILKKVGEEAAELIIAAKDASNCLKTENSEIYNNLVVEETADLFYHVLVTLAELDIPLSDVEAMLEKRFAKTGNKKI